MLMNENKRIIYNTMATYGRSVFALVLGLFSSRWVLAALGRDDFGLFGVVGSIIVFVGLLNGIMSSAVARYYAFAIGQARSNHDGGHDNIVRWFNSALLIHTALPIMLVGIGYPIGRYAIKNWLAIQPDRLESCLAVFSFALFSAFINMVSVPYIAMYRAKQLIAELSFWGMLSTVLTFVFAFMLRYWAGDRLIAYAAYMTLVPTIISIIQVLRAMTQFDVCIVKLRYLFEVGRIKQLFNFAFGEFFGWVGSSIRDNGIPMLINVNFGSGVNAAYSIANQVSGQTVSLSSAMIGALVPAVTSAEGEGDHDRAIRLSFRSIKFGVMLILVFCIPLVLEIDTVLRLWLVNPPEYTAEFCQCVLIALVAHKLGWGHHLSLLAKGKIVCYQITVGAIGASGLLLAWIAIKMGFGVVGIGVSLVVNYSLMTLARVVFARKLCSMSLVVWLRDVVFPILLTMGLALLAGFVVVYLLPPTAFRVIVTTLISNLLLALGGWALALDRYEREYFSRKVLLALDSFRGSVRNWRS